MLRRLPPLPTLAAFESVARHRSFVRAAQELCITRSAVSHRIRALEHYFGAQLFVRRRSTVTPTSEGALLLDAVMNALSMLESACEKLAVHNRRAVRISVGLAFASAWLMQRLSTFHRLHRDIDLEISALRLAQPNKLACLQSGEADVVISYGTAGDWKGFEYLEILKCRMFPVCAPAYRAAIGPLDTPQSLLKTTLLRLPRQPWRPWFKAAGLVCQEPDRGPLFSHAGLMLDAAVNGQGVALVRDVLVEEDLKAGRLVRLFDAAVECAYFAVYLPKAKARPEVAAFLNWLTTVAGASTESPGSEERLVTNRL